MKRLFFISFLFFFLISCSSDDVEQNLSEEKKDFYVDVVSGSEQMSQTFLEKTGQVRSTQDITLSTNILGRVNSVGVKKGDTVQAGQPIVFLSDTLGNLSINLERAKNAVERAEIQYESTKVSFEKQIFDIETQKTTLERSLETLLKDAEQNIKLAEDAFNNANISGLDSKSLLQIEQFDANLERQKLDFETRIISDNQTREGFINFLLKDENTLRVLIDNVVDFSDPILSVSEKNRFTNSAFSTYLGAKNTAQRGESEALLRDLIALREGTFFTDFRTFISKGEMSDEEILIAFETLSQGYDILREFIPSMNMTLINSIESVGQLSGVVLDGYRAQISGYQATFQGNYAAYLQTSNQAQSFIKTYLASQDSQKKSINLQEKEREILILNLQTSSLSAETGLERTRIGIDDQVKNLESQIINIKNTLETTMKNRDINLRSMENSLKEAQISYRAALNDIQKLTLTSPINGTISNVVVDVGQEVSPGSPVVQIIADNTPEVQVSFSKNEKDFVRIGQKVGVSFASEVLEGTIYSLSEVADENLNYNATIIFDSGVNIIGSIVQVKIPIETSYFLLPLNIIETQGEGIGKIITLSGSTLQPVRVRLGYIYGDMVEIVSCAQDCASLDIVFNDVSKYNENDFILKRR